MNNPQELANILLSNLENDFTLIDEYIQSIVINYFHKINVVLHLINHCLRNVDIYYDTFAVDSSVNQASCGFPSANISALAASKRQTRVKCKILDQTEKQIFLVKSLILSSIQTIKINVTISNDLFQNELPLPSQSLREFPLFLPKDRDFLIQSYLLDSSLNIDKKITYSLSSFHENLNKLILEIQFKQQRLLELIDSGSYFAHHESTEKRQFYVKFELFNDKIDFLRNLQLISMNLSQYKHSTCDQFLVKQQNQVSQLQREENEERKQQQSERVSSPFQEKQSYYHHHGRTDSPISSEFRGSPPKKMVLKVGMEIFYRSTVEFPSSPGGAQLLSAVLLSFDESSRECRIRIKDSGKEKDTIYDRIIF
jgi:gas vesicle protein